MSTDLEVDDSSKSLIASWFGIDREKGDEPVCSSEKKPSKKKRRVDKSKEKSNEVLKVSEPNKKQVFTSGLTQKKTMSSFVGEKLQKKLTKLKHRKENAAKDEEIKKKTTPPGIEMKSTVKINKKHKVKNISSNDDDDDDCSKVKLVKKTTKEISVTMTAVDVLKKTLNEDKNLSKNQKKRIKKKIQKLLQGNEKGTTKIDESSGNKEKTNEKNKTEEGSKMKKEVKGKSKTNSNDKTNDPSQKDTVDGENIVKKKKRKKKSKENLEESTISNISITNDIAVIESPKKKVKISQSATDCGVSTNKVSKHEKKKNHVKEKEDQSKGSDMLNSGIKGNTGEFTQHNKNKKKNKNIRNGAVVSVGRNSSEGSSPEKRAANENADTGLKNKHKKKKLKSGKSVSEGKLTLEQTGHTNVNNKHSKKEIEDTSHIKTNGARNSSDDDLKDSNKSDDLGFNKNVKKKKHKMSESTSEASSPKKRNVETDHDQAITNNSTMEEEVPRKRKRHKTRSKQKNIKKDHRPEHMKPAYLQQSSKTETKDNNE